MNFSKLHFFDIKVLTLCHGFFMWFLATDAWLMFCYKILYFDFMWNQWSSRQFSFWIYTVFFFSRISLNGLSEWANMRMQVDLCPLLDVVNGMHFRFFDTIHKFPNGLWALCRSILSQQSNVPTTAHTQPLSTEDRIHFLTDFMADNIHTCIAQKQNHSRAYYSIRMHNLLSIIKFRFIICLKVNRKIVRFVNHTNAWRPMLFSTFQWSSTIFAGSEHHQPGFFRMSFFYSFSLSFSFSTGPIYSGFAS